MIINQGQGLITKTITHQKVPFFQQPSASWAPRNLDAAPVGYVDFRPLAVNGFQLPRLLGGTPHGGSIRIEFPDQKTLSKYMPTILQTNPHIGLVNKGIDPLSNTAYMTVGTKTVTHVVKEEDMWPLYDALDTFEINADVLRERVEMWIDTFLQRMATNFPSLFPPSSLPQAKKDLEAARARSLTWVATTDSQRDHWGLLHQLQDSLINYQMPPYSVTQVLPNQGGLTQIASQYQIHITSV